MFFADFSVNSQQIFMTFCKHYFQENPNSSENFVKLAMAYFIKIILEFYYLPNGLTFEIFNIINIILRIFYRC